MGVVRCRASRANLRTCVWIMIRIPIANYNTTQLGEFYAARRSHNIQSVMYYVLDSDHSTYGITINGAPVNAPYAAFTGFTAAHADD